MPFSVMIDSLFASGVAQDGTYTPASGQPKAVRVISSRPDVDVGIAGIEVRVGTTRFDIRSSDVAAPGEGDQLVVAGVTYAVLGAMADRDRLVWTLDMVPA